MRTIILYKRASTILLTLINAHDPITISYLRSLTKASDRSIRYDLDNIDQFLKEQNLSPLQRVPGTGIYFMGNREEQESIKKLLDDVNIYNYVPMPDERKVLIVLEFIMSQGYITVDYLTETLDVSRNTINSDLKDIKEILSKYKLKLDFRQRYGLILNGLEINIRKLLVELIIKYFLSFYANDFIMSTATSKLIFNSMKDTILGDLDISFLKGVVNSIEEELGLDYSDLAYENILAHIIVSLIRIKSGNYVCMNAFNSEIVKETNEFGIIRDMKMLFEDLYNITITEAELVFVATSLLGGNFSTNLNITKGDWIFIQVMVRNFIESVNSELMVDISKDWKLYHSLLAHIKPMLNRIRYRIKLENPLTNNIKKNYGSLYKIVKNSVGELEKFVGKKMSEEEICYLTLHFGGAIERVKVNSLYKPRVLIVCETGLGTSELLMIQIQSLFDLNIVGVTSRRKLDETLKHEQIDMVISTIPIETEKNTRILIVDAILSDRDIKNLNAIFFKFKKTNIEIKGLLSLIEQNATIHDYKQLEKDLYNIFNMKSMWDSNTTEKPDLLDTISAETIRLKAEADDWEGAVRIGGQLLVDAGAVEERYVDAMVNAVKEYGPYIVISENVAMPHAKSEDGVKKTKVSIVTFKNSINFGSKDSRDIKLMICISTINSTNHLKALSQLMVLLENDNEIKEIIDTDNKSKVINIIAKYSY